MREPGSVLSVGVSAELCGPPFRTTLCIYEAGEMGKDKDFFFELSITENILEDVSSPFLFAYFFF